MQVVMPSQLRRYTGGNDVVEAQGTTLAELLADLERQFPGVRHHIVDEQDRVRRHISVWIDAEREENLGRILPERCEVQILGALSGG
jgi:molybdopterin converting factor small subunit